MDLGLIKHEDVLDAAGKFIERRSETRYKMGKGVITVRKPHHSQYSRRGSVIDICKGGKVTSIVEFKSKSFYTIKSNIWANGFNGQ